MPRQLRIANRRRKKEPRPLVELLPRVDIGDLCRWRVFPNNWHTSHYFEMPFRLNFIKHLVISLENVEAIHYSGYNQIIPLRWCPTGFGGLNRQRPLFICNCGRSVRKVYFTYGSLKCRRCASAVYASQVCSGKRMRTELQIQRLRNFLKFKRYMSTRTRQLLTAYIAKAPIKELRTKRLSHHSIMLPIDNYGTYGPMHWR
jgi:ribosomal protein L34E